MAGHANIPRVRTRVRRNDATHPLTDQERLDAPTRVNKLPELTRGDDDPVAKREQQISQVELLMLKGFTTPISIQGMLDFDRKHTERYMDLVRARWEMYGGNKNFEAHRGRQIARMELLMQEAWVLYQNSPEASSKDISNKRAILQSIANMNKQMSELHGITARSVARQMMASTDRGDIVKRMEKQEKLAEVAGMLANLLKKRRGDDAKLVEAEVS